VLTAAVPLAFISGGGEWLAVLLLIVAVLAVGYAAFGPSALGLPTWIALLVVLAAFNVPWPFGFQLLGAFVGGLLVLLVMGFAMRSRSAPPGRDDPPPPERGGRPPEDSE
jgi:uncharacterized membrane protein YhaH (DUF805 family)